PPPVSLHDALPIFTGPLGRNGRGAQCSRSLTWLARSVDEFLGSRPSLNGSGSELSITSASGSASALGVWSLRRGELGKTTDNSRRSDHNLGSRIVWAPWGSNPRPAD